MSATLDYLKQTLKVVEYGSGREFQKIRPSIECVDGFKVSVQGSEGHYCSPRKNGWMFDTVEVGYPSEKVDEFMPFCERPETPTDTVYGWVPVEIVDAVIAKHGGIKH